VKEGDVIRFGRIPFKIAKLVLDISSHGGNGTSKSMIEVSQEDIAVVQKKSVAER